LGGDRWRAGRDRRCLSTEIAHAGRGGIVMMGSGAELGGQPGVAVYSRVKTSAVPGVGQVGRPYLANGAPGPARVDATVKQ
jgi:hypothetical protein